MGRDFSEGNRGRLLGKQLGTDLATESYPLHLSSDTTPLVAWFNPRTGVVYDSSNLLSSWQDVINGYTIGASGALRPTYSGPVSGLNNRPGVVFGGTQYLYGDIGLAGLLDAVQDYTLYIVRRADAAYSAGDVVACWASATTFALHGASGASAVPFVWRNNGSGSSVNTAGTVGANNAIAVCADIFTGTAYNAWVNGTISINGTAFSQNVGTCSRFALGTRIFPNGVADRIWNGDIGDVLVYLGQHSTEKRVAMQDWLADRYGV